MSPTARLQQETKDQNDDEEECRDDSNEDEDCFFESLDRVPSSVSVNFGIAYSDSSDDKEDDDVRISFASAVGPPSDFMRRARSATFNSDDDELDINDDLNHDESCSGRPSVSMAGEFGYNMWTAAESFSFNERRRRFRKDMGLSSSKDLSAPPPTSLHRLPSSSATAVAGAASVDHPTSSTVLTRSHSDAQLTCNSLVQPLRRSSSAPPCASNEEEPQQKTEDSNIVVDDRDKDKGAGSEGGAGGAEAEGKEEEDSRGAFTIKNLDDGKEFVVSEVRKDGSWGRLNDLQTGIQFTLEEFEKFLGYSPIVKEFMRRVKLDKKSNGSTATPPSSSKNSKSGGSSNRKKGSGWLKNFKVVASSMTGLKEESAASSGRGGEGGACGSEWMKVRQHGKSYKELTGLYLCQEIQAHKGSIWCIKFSPNSKYLASAGEDRVVHIWEVVERDAVTPALRCEDTISCSSKNNSTEQPESGPSLSRSSRLPSRPSKPPSMKNSSTRALPKHIVLPETIFSLSNEPICSFEGHLDEVLDISWSKSQHLLTSSMDKTVRLWDMESKTCLKLFAHNDYVTCIQFNPVDERYFISGSLDHNFRIWSIPDRHVVYYSKLNEMVTAACYTPDGQGAIVGTHKGSCRFYRTSDNTLVQEGQIDISNKRSKSNAKKITGLQFAPGNPSEVLITAADSQIRVFDGLSMVRKYRGFRNTSSQISASFTSDGKYVVCASEDSHVYVWRHNTSTLNSANGGGKAKGTTTTRSHEYFQCPDVSVAIPWPCSGSNADLPLLPPWSSRRKDAYDDSHLSSNDSLIRCSSTLGDSCNQLSDRNHSPPLIPKKKYCTSEQPSPPPDELRRSESTYEGSSSFSSGSASSSIRRSGPLTFGSSSSLLSWGWSGGGSNRSTCSSIEDSNAWGLVVVTAGLGGNIRVYQNFGLPLRLNRPSNFF